MSVHVCVWKGGYDVSICSKFAIRSKMNGRVGGRG